MATWHPSNGTANSVWGGESDGYVLTTSATSNNIAFYGNGYTDIKFTVAYDEPEKPKRRRPLIGDSGSALAWLDRRVDEMRVKL